LIALLIADASPELRTGTEPMSVVVSGATTHEIPSPNRRIEGRTSTRVPTGGTRVDGEANAASHGSLVAGIRASQSSPAAMSSGPATRNGRAPTRPAIDPMRADSRVSMAALGS